MAIGIIGGSGFYEWLGGTAESLETPFGISSPMSIVDAKGPRVCFLARHGEDHSLPPHLVNYRANIFALRKAGASHVIATNAVGSCTTGIKPGEFLVPDQLIDLTTGRESTFYTGDYKEEVPAEFKKVKHTDVSYPYRGEVRRTLLEVLSSAAVDYHPHGTYVATNGPRFETAAEIQMAKLLGGGVVGMTSAPEAFLARELDIDYASICLVTNYAAGMQEEISQTEVVELFDSRMNELREIITMFIERMKDTV